MKSNNDFLSTIDPTIRRFIEQCIECCAIVLEYRHQHNLSAEECLKWLTHAAATFNMPMTSFTDQVKELLGIYLGAEELYSEEPKEPFYVYLRMEKVFRNMITVISRLDETRPARDQEARRADARLRSELFAETASMLHRKRYQVN